VAYPNGGVDFQLQFSSFNLAVAMRPEASSSDTAERVRKDTPCRGDLLFDEINIAGSKTTGRVNSVLTKQITHDQAGAGPFFLQDEFSLARALMDTDVREAKDVRGRTKTSSSCLKRSNCTFFQVSGIGHDGGLLSPIWPRAWRYPWNCPHVKSP